MYNFITSGMSDLFRSSMFFGGMFSSLLVFFFSFFPRDSYRRDFSFFMLARHINTRRVTYGTQKEEQTQTQGNLQRTTTGILLPLYRMTFRMLLALRRVCFSYG